MVKNNFTCKNFFQKIQNMNLMPAYAEAQRRQNVAVDTSRRQCRPVGEGGLQRLCVSGRWSVARRSNSEKLHFLLDNDIFELYTCACVRTRNFSMMLNWPHHRRCFTTLARVHVHATSQWMRAWLTPMMCFTTLARVYVHATNQWCEPDLTSTICLDP